MTVPRTIFMLGPSMESRGGIASVIAAYRAYGFFANLPVAYCATTCDGSRLRKSACVLSAFGRMCLNFVCGRVAALHLHTASRMSFWRKSVFACLAYVFGRPVMFHVHGGAFLDFVTHECGPVQRRFLSFVLSQATAVIVLSDSWQRNLRGVIPTARIEVVPNPVASLECSASEGSSTPTILFLGRIEREKGIYDLLAACAELHIAGCPVTLLCGGTGQTTEAVAEARRLKIDRHVRWLGWVDGERKQALFHQAALLVLPSYREGLPMSILEAMAAGLPVVTTPVGGIPDVIQSGTHGLLIPPGQVSQLRDAIRSILDQPEIGRRMGHAAQASVRARYSVEKVCASLETLYRSAGLLPSR